ncbi:hypothetical protein Pfo_023115 [Paulownia fortunei]|nr:hypothetical protein Pfo_023115 [Paulownia fortunei]
MSSFVGVLVFDQWLQSQFTQVELRSLKSKFVSMKNQNGKVTVGDLPPLMMKIKAFSEIFNEEEIRTYLDLQSRANAKVGNLKNSSSFLKATTTTLLHSISESEKASYVVHINSYLRDDPFLKQFPPIDPSSNALFDLAKDGAIGCTVVNIGTQDLPHLVLGLISQIIKIQLLADLNLRRHPSLQNCSMANFDQYLQDVEELMGLAPEKVLLKWMNFHLKKAGYKKTVTNFSSDLKDGEAYAYLLNILAPEHFSPATLDANDPAERANLVLEHAEKMDYKRYLTPKDIVEGSTNLNLAFVAQIFHQRKLVSFSQEWLVDRQQKHLFCRDDELISREERCFRLWINGLGIVSYVNNLFEDVRNGWILLEVLDKVYPDPVNWTQATKPPIKIPFRKVENCNQVVRIGKQLKLSLVNVAGNDFVQGNKKLIIAFLRQLMRFNMLQLVKNLRSCFQGKEITDADILNWANQKVKSLGRKSQMELFKYMNGIAIYDCLMMVDIMYAYVVEPQVVNWNLVTKGECDEEKKLNATYIFSVARKLGCSIFLLPEDIMEV